MSAETTGESPSEGRSIRTQFELLMEFLAPRKSKTQITTNAEFLPSKSRKPETFAKSIHNLVTEKPSPRNCKGKDIFFPNSR